MIILLSALSFFIVDGIFTHYDTVFVAEIFYDSFNYTRIKQFLSLTAVASAWLLFTGFEIFHFYDKKLLKHQNCLTRNIKKIRK